MTTPKAFETKLRALALGYPETHEDFPWGERVIKVKGKVFIFMGMASGPKSELCISVKLPATHTLALALPYMKPTGYGLGKAGWVSARFPANELPPFDLIAEWLDESYRAVAPKKLIASIATSTPRTTPSTPKARKPPGAKKTTKKGRR